MLMCQMSLRKWYIMNNFKCMFYEEKTIDGQACFRCKNVKNGMQACKLKDEFCGYFEDCEFCKNQDESDKCQECCLRSMEES